MEISATAIDSLEPAIDSATGYDVSPVMNCETSSPGSYPQSCI